MMILRLDKISKRFQGSIQLYFICNSEEVPCLDGIGGYHWLEICHLQIKSILISHPISLEFEYFQLYFSEKKVLGKS